LNTSISLPAHAAGDMLIIAAGGGGGDSIPSVPSGWTQINSVSSAVDWLGIVCAYKVAADDSETSGTWDGAYQLVAAVYDGVASIGGTAKSVGSSTVTYPGITMSVSDGSSWVVGVGIFNGGAAYSTPPAGMTHRNGLGTSEAISGSLGLHDTAAGTSSWSSKSVWYGGNSCAAITFELVSE
jgi:hypothetical protein